MDRRISQFAPDDEVLLRRDLVRVPKGFIRYRLSVGLPIPAVIAETERGTFVSYFFRKNDPVLTDVIRDAKRWIEPDGPFRHGNVVKAARYFLGALIRAGVITKDAELIESYSQSNG